MHGNKKVVAIIFTILFVFLIVNIIVLSINFRKFSQDKEIEKAKVVASLIEDGLTSHMMSGTMNQRELFLKYTQKSSGALELWTFRTDKVKKLFGKGFKYESLRDAIDKKMVETGKIQTNINESIFNPTLRVTVPYIATNKEGRDCLSCHTNANVGDILGGTSMVFDMENARDKSIILLAKIFIIALIFTIFFTYLINRFLKPYIGALFSIEKSLRKASKGDYSSRIKIRGNDETTDTFKWLNALLEKLENTIGAIEKNLSLFISDRNKIFKDPLEKSKSIVEDISDIYKFKRTIEQDLNKEIIYERLVKIFKTHLGISDISMYEVDVKKDIRILIYDDTPEKFCDIADHQTSEHCRAYRTKSIVTSDDFEDVCKACTTHKEYLCINYPIDENITLVINIKPADKEELFENKKVIGYIKNYLESARPVLQNKILTEILQRSNMIDGLTQIYNRKYLDIFMDTKIKGYKEYSLAMIDIDFFKKVNDTFGHDAGDIVLKGLSDIFRRSIKPEDIAFRFGGEEFVIFMPDVKSAKETVQNIKDNFEDTTFNLNGQSLKKTLSAGIACYTNDGSSPWQIIKYTDVAMYEAKNSGRNKIVLYHDIEKDKTNLKNDGEY